MAAFRRLREKLGLRKAEPPWPDHVQVGRHTYGATRRTFSRATAAAPITIGNFCSIGPDVLIFGQVDHPTDLVSTYPFRTLLYGTAGENRDAVTRGGVTIGHDVWIGARAMILSGVTIGDGAVIGAGAVVRSDVPAYCVAVGNPARVVWRRFEPDVIAALLEIRWWEWPDEKIRTLDAAFYGPVEAFIAAART